MCYVVNMFPPFLKKEKKENQLSFYRLLQWPQVLELWVWIVIYLEWIPFILASLRFISPLFFTWAGLQAVQGIHHCSGSNEAHMPRLLEDDLWERVWGGCDAVRPGGEWKGRTQPYWCRHWAVMIIAFWSHECPTIGYPCNLGGAVPMVTPVTERGQN